MLCNKDNNFKIEEKSFKKLTELDSIKFVTLNFRNYVFQDISNQNFFFDECLLNHLQLRCNTNYFFAYKDGIWLNEEIGDGSISILQTIQFLSSHFARYIKQNAVVQYSKTNDRKCFQSRNKGIFDLLYSYCFLLNNYIHVNDVNMKIIKQLEKLTKNKIDKVDDTKVCESCSAFKERLMALEEKYHDMKRTCSSMKTEKERIIMRYATGEKQLLEIQKLAKSFEKKSENLLKENAAIQKKFNKAQETIAKLNGEINSKFSEITQLRHQLERKKDDMNSKEMLLKWTRNKLDTVTDAEKETRRKFNETVVRVSELTKECDGLKLKLFNCFKEIEKSKDDKVIVTDDTANIQRKCFSLQNSPCKISCTLNQDSFNSASTEKQSTGRDITPLLAEINSLQQENSTFKKELAIANLLLKQEKEKVFSLQEQRTKMETLEKLIQTKELNLLTMETNLARLNIERNELLSDMEACREREIQMVDFTQKLIDKNVQLQVELSELQSEVVQLNDKQKPLNENICEFSKELQLLKQHLAVEKSSREYECGVLTKYIAEKVYENEKLQQRLSESQAEISIVQRKYEAAVGAMKRELHLYHAKLKKNTQFHDKSVRKTDALNEKNGSTEERTVNFFLNKGELLQKMVQLQEINVKRAEKLDFLEQHSNALLEELQKKKTTEKSW